MEDFIRKFSTVPTKFINDFFNISKEYYNDNDFNINFDLVVKWLNDAAKNNNIDMVMISNRSSRLARRAELAF